MKPPNGTETRVESRSLPSEPSPGSRLEDLPILLAALYHGFRLLIDRLRMSDGLGARVRLGMGSIFFALCEEDDCIIKRLADRLYLPKATLTGLLDAMEKAGVVERHPCPDDGRAYRVRLTPNAQAMKASMIQRHDRAVAILQGGLDAQEAVELRRMMKHLLQNLRADEERCRKAQKAKRYQARLAHHGRRRKRTV